MMQISPILFIKTVISLLTPLALFQHSFFMSFSFCEKRFPQLAQLFFCAHNFSLQFLQARNSFVLSANLSGNFQTVIFHRTSNAKERDTDILDTCCCSFDHSLFRLYRLCLRPAGIILLSFSGLVCPYPYIVRFILFQLRDPL